MSNIVLFDSGHRLQPAAGAGFFARATAAIDRIRSSWRRFAGLESLRGLDDRLLRDVGLDRAEFDQSSVDTEIVLRAVRREWFRWAP